MHILEHITTAQERGWGWFQQHARSRFALLWLALLGFADTVFFPISVEAFLAALVLAHRDRWKAYLAVSWISSMLGAAVGYAIFFYAFRAFGEPFLQSWGLQEVYEIAQSLLGAQIFFTMLLATFTPLPDKLFIYAAGILGAPFVPYILGFMIGRGARMAVVTWVVHRFGAPVLELVNKYSTLAAIIAVILMVGYVMVRVYF